MAKTIFLLSLSFVLIQVKHIAAQNLIAVQNGGTPKFYSILQDAIASAQNKDTIYIPGGAYSFTDSKITIDKELHFIGVGHVPDSTSATGITQLNASVYLINGANNSSFEGIYFSGSFWAGKSPVNENVDNIAIFRCNCDRVNLCELSSNWAVYENVIRGGVVGRIANVKPYAQNNLFSNNIIEQGVFYFGPNNKFTNNFFVYSSSNYSLINSLSSLIMRGIDECDYKNNIFGDICFYEVTSCKFENNLSFKSLTTYIYGSIGNNNLDNQSSATTFVNQSGSTFSYEQDYHLKSTSPGKNAGKDGTDIGIYGGAFPWKEGSVPSNPHFQAVKIAPKTDASGKLNVTIKVAAQDH